MSTQDRRRREVGISRIRIRIGFRVGPYPEISETFVQSQISGMLERGHEVSVLGDDLRSPREGPGRARVYSSKPRSGLLRTLHQALPWRVKALLVSAVERRWAEQVDVVVCNFGWFGAQLARTLRRAETPRLVTIFHGADLSRSLCEADERVYDELFNRCNLMLCVSDLWRSRLLALGADPNKVRVHRMGVALSQYRFVPKPRDRPVSRILHVGRLVEKKGADFLLQALALARRRMPERPLRLDIVGDGPLDASLRRRAEELGITEAVSFLGPLAHEAVRERLADADLFVLPSVTAADGDMEGIPVALMEAMAAGVPVISTYHSGIPELIQHRVNGLLAAERDPEDLFHQIRELVTDPDTRLSMVGQARRTIEEQFDETKLQDELSTILTELVGGQTSGSSPRRATG